ncbi:MAG: PTS system mannose/fructose/sorbose family transporter subunit IID [Herbinix sp.]|nr:PTS system mannose/fructose/sorbose family transporter subunit IID [Herbinix sp.]
MNSNITKKDLNKTMWRSCGCSFSWGYERQGNIAYAYAMIPILKKIYTQKDKMAESLKRHLEFYNVTNQCMTFNLGISAAMEEEASQNSEFDNSAINKTKVAVMGPISGIGDAFFWGTFKIIATAIGTTFALKGSILGPILFFLLYNIPAFAVRIGLMKAGYGFGAKFLAQVGSNGIMGQLLKAATILGLFVVGGMCASLVNLNIIYEISDGANSQTISDLLNQIMPCLSSLLVFALTYWGVIVKKVQPVMMIVIMTMVGIIGAFLGILG